ncbi:hypothetical protein AWB81_03305 [Caballeronia arationis]|uniref:Uncharacterized protein n=1 Tax=Caballeronia arationis TaxID=1777142 RepID=A0A7Z7ICI2_9BURK|nr:hypothetical protein [Caballeronia arationis]SAK72860.1 hypothetical protein AWB81_03305 [Caballeronia arationis]SOE88171.1 hypothetical protein SAMN05446927_6768 [Caballeronia arationis]
MNFRMISVSAAAALGLVCSEGASASTIVRVTYMAPAIVYAPPPRPVYYYVPAAPTYVVPVAAPIVPLPPPRPTTVVVQPAYAVAPMRVGTYTQPVMVVPVAGMH